MPTGSKRIARSPGVGITGIREPDGGAGTKLSSSASRA